MLCNLNADTENIDGKKVRGFFWNDSCNSKWRCIPLTQSFCCLWCRKYRKFLCFCTSFRPANANVEFSEGRRMNLEHQYLKTITFFRTEKRREKETKRKRKKRYLENCHRNAKACQWHPFTYGHLLPASNSISYCFWSWSKLISLFTGTAAHTQHPN